MWYLRASPRVPNTHCQKSNLDIINKTRLQQCPKPTPNIYLCPKNDPSLARFPPSLGTPNPCFPVSSAPNSVTHTPSSCLQRPSLQCNCVVFHHQISVHQFPSCGLVNVIIVVAGALIAFQSGTANSYHCPFLTGGQSLDQ